MKLQFGEYSFEFVAKLPFSWRLLFTAAILFTLASLLYNIFAPSIIKENKSFGEFSRKKRTFAQIVDYMADLGIAKHSLESKYGIALNGVPGETRFYQSGNKQENQNYNEALLVDNLMNAYTSVRSFAIFNRPLILIVSFLLYILGILCLGYVIFQNAIEVYS